MTEKRPFSRVRSGATEPGKLDALLAYVASDFKLWEFSRKPQLGLYYLAQ
jgi:hypothetical protein